MIRLIESGLMGGKLVSVDTPLMVKRYNACLEDIGFEETKLKSFHIDGWGWSPEIAEEKGDHFYLSHGLANPFSIIITPEQKNSPLYMPYHSFDWDIHQKIFQNYALQIEDVTSQYGMWFELDQNIMAYRNAHDLLMLEVVNVIFNVTSDIQDASKYQKRLISEYSSKQHAWLDKSLREKIIQTSIRFGDLRYRNVELPDLPISNISTYYTVAFGGLFVFKKLAGDKPLLIFENNSSEVSNEQKHMHLEYNISDHSFIPFLYNQRMLDTDPFFFKEHLFLLEHQLEYQLVKAAIEEDETIKISTLNRTQKKGLANHLYRSRKLGEDYLDLENLINTLKSRRLGDVKIPKSLHQQLLHPHDRCEQEEKAVIWQLLTAVRQDNPVLNYIFNKSSFYKEYQTWKEPMKEWAIETILESEDVFEALTD